MEEEGEAESNQNTYFSTFKFWSFWTWTGAGEGKAARKWPKLAVKLAKNDGENHSSVQGQSSRHSRKI